MRYIYSFVLVLSMQMVTTAQTTVNYAPSKYRNLEKYWWYRYRLVNDFMKVGTGCGESIPMERWEFHYGGDRELDRASWGDATQHLGNYILTLSGEWWVLNHVGMSTRRTEEELYDALFAFERLDKKAEASWRQYDNGYPFCTQNDNGNFPYEQAGDQNGFFIRDDVPSISTIDKNPITGLRNFMEQNEAHFHRPGFYYRSPKVKMEEDFGSDANVDMPNHPSNAGPGWAYARGAAEVSQDQMVMLYAGMGIAGNLLKGGPTYNGWDLGEKAREQLYRMYSFPAFNYCGPMPWQLCNPVTNSCVGDKSSSCSNGGAWIFSSSVGAVVGLNYIGLPAALPHPYWALMNTTYQPGWKAAYQLTQWISPTPTKRDWFYPTSYTAFADDWIVGIPMPFGLPSIGIVHTTKTKLVNHSMSNDICWPQLPLIWQLVHGGPGSTCWFNSHTYGQPWYTELFDYAPFCGCHSYESDHSLYRAAYAPTDYGKDLDYGPTSPAYPGTTIHQEAWQWSCANRLQDWNKRGDYGLNQDFNNLDYMSVWNINTIVEGQGALPKGFMNPYYRENYNVDYPLSNGYGNITTPLKLNFLEYLSMVNKINSGAKVSFRGAKEIDLLPGFEAKRGGVFDAVVRDYRCQDEGYVYALANGTPLEDNNNRLRGDSLANDTAYHPLDFPPDGVPFIVEPDSARIYENVLNSDTATEEQEAAYRDSLISVVLATGDSNLINYIRPLLTNSNRPSNRLAANSATIQKKVTVYPSPNGGTFVVGTLSDEIYHLQVFSAIGALVYDNESARGPYTSVRLADNLPAGAYTVKVISPTIQHIAKIIIVR